MVLSNIEIQQAIENSLIIFDGLKDITPTPESEPDTSKITIENNKVLYNNAVYTGVYQTKYYVSGVLASGITAANDRIYNNGILYNEFIIHEGKIYYKSVKIADAGLKDFGLEMSATNIQEENSYSVEVTNPPEGSTTTYASPFKLYKVTLSNSISSTRYCMILTLSENLQNLGVQLCNQGLIFPSISSSASSDNTLYIVSPKAISKNDFKVVASFIDSNKDLNGVIDFV